MLQKGDRIVFKKRKRRAIYGTVDHVETNLDKMYWSAASGVPRYIRIALDPDRAGNVAHVWVTESKINYVPPKEK